MAVIEAFAWEYVLLCLWWILGLGCGFMAGLHWVVTAYSGSRVRSKCWLLEVEALFG